MATIGRSLMVCDSWTAMDIFAELLMCVIVVGGHRQAVSSDSSSKADMITLHELFQYSGRSWEDAPE